MDLYLFLNLFMFEFTCRVVDMCLNSTVLFDAVRVFLHCQLTDESLHMKLELPLLTFLHCYPHYHTCTELEFSHPLGVSVFPIDVKLQCGMNPLWI